EIGGREADHPRASWRDRGLLEREVVLFLAPEQDGAERRAQELDVADAELLRDVQGERVLEAGRVLDRVPGCPTVPESRCGQVETDDELAGLLRRHCCRLGRGCDGRDGAHSQRCRSERDSSHENPPCPCCKRVNLARSARSSPAATYR